jgi:hypothetical protein
VDGVSVSVVAARVDFHAAARGERSLFRAVKRIAPSATFSVAHALYRRSKVPSGKAGSGGFSENMLLIKTDLAVYL